MNTLKVLRAVTPKFIQQCPKSVLSQCRYRIQTTTRVSGKQYSQSLLKWNGLTYLGSKQIRWYKTINSVKPDSAAPRESGKVLHIEWPDGSKSRFHSVWLRHNCHCPECKQPDSGQKTLDIANISPNIAIQSVKLTGSEVEIQWSCGHIGNIPYQYLLSTSYTTEALNRRAKEIQLNSQHTVTSLPSMEFAELQQSQQNILKWLTIINEYGLCKLTSVPLQDSMVQQVADMIDRTQHTIYGETFDVVSSPQPINIAYSSVALDLHMDLVYYESPPGLQLLHVLRYDDCVEGGDSVFLDVFQVAEDFRIQHPDHFQTLTEVPATFQKVHYSRESPVHMTYQRPHIMVNRQKEIVSVTWAPPFEGALCVPEDDVERYYNAYQKFAVALEESPFRIIQKMTEGDLIVFNNRRMLHGRLSFNLNGGIRHLKGCYVNIDHFKNKLQVLSNTIGDGALAKRVGNHDWF